MILNVLSPGEMASKSRRYRTTALEDGPEYFNREKGERGWKDRVTVKTNTKSHFRELTARSVNTIGIYVCSALQSNSVITNNFLV